MTTRPRDRADRCPGVLRPWLADDGGLIRIRAIGGSLNRRDVASLSEIATRYGDGMLHLTKRANLQLRALPVEDGALPAEVEEAVLATGLVPFPSHERARNVMVSPLSGISGGRADLRPVAAELDRLLCADPALAALPGRFLFVLDDGRGDLLDRTLDLGLVALDDGRAQVRAGAHWGPVVGLDVAAAAVLDLARAFLDVRGAGPTAAWHVDELDAPLTDLPRDRATEVRAAPAPYGVEEAYEHRHVPDGLLGPVDVQAIVTGPYGERVVITPWHGLVLVPA